MVKQYLTKEIFYIYFILINIISFSCFFIDKRRAKRKEYRISESFLLGISILGGGLGSLLGMRVFKHKTKKGKFTIGLPIILVLNIGIIVYLLQYLGQ